MRGGTASGWFLNGVALLESSLPADQLLAGCRALEERAGRRRACFWGDRTLDLDLLVVEGEVRDDPALTLPHPGIERRRFVWGPLLEVWPDVVDPRTGRPYAERVRDEGPAPVPVGVFARGDGPMYLGGHARDRRTP